VSSLVLELQSDALNSSVSTLDVLRKALVVARKLGIEKFQKWIEVELEGYDGVPLPKYRSTRGQLRAWNPYHGWRPIRTDSKDLQEAYAKVCDCSISQPISELIFLANSEGDELQMQLPFQAESFLVSTVRTSVKISISKVSVQGIVEAVRDIILQWALQLEEDGVTGEGMTFSKEEKQIAARHDYGSFIQINIDQAQMQNSSSESQANSGTFSNNLSGANVANFANQVTDNARQQANQYNYSLEQRQTLVEAAAEIQKLLEQLSQTYSMDTLSGRMQLATEAVTRIESNPNLMQRLVSSLQAGGVSALEQFLNHPAASFVIAALEDWQKTKGKQVQ
jgi:AbiTii